MKYIDWVNVGLFIFFKVFYYAGYRDGKSYRNSPKPQQCVQLHMDSWVCTTVDGRTDNCVQFVKGDK